MANNACTLRIDGQVYGGWTRLEVQRGIENMAGGFILSLTHRWPDMGTPPGLREGLPCAVYLGDDLVITGYITTIDLELDATRADIRVEGSDKTKDLVDCSAIHSTGQWRGVKLEQIVRDIAAPFGIGVLVEVDTGEAFQSFALEDGEKAFEAIDRAARLRAIQVTSTPKGQILLTRAGTVDSGVRLEEGVNFTRISARHSWEERYSQITFKAQTPGTDQSYGATAAHVQASAADSEIDRYRPLIVQSEHNDSTASLKERAIWEATTRMGRGKRGEVEVVGWRTGRDGMKGALWQPNQLVHVTSARMQLDMVMLITGCNYTLSSNGMTTRLEFCRPEAFELISTDAERGKKRRRKKTDFRASWERPEDTIK